MNFKSFKKTLSESLDKRLTHLKLSNIRCSLPKINPEKPRVLLVALANFPYACKLEGMLALGLKLQGCEVISLLETRRMDSARSYHLAFGVDRCVYWEDYQVSSNVVQIEWENLKFDFRGIKELTYRDCWIGPQILSEVCRNLRGSAFHALDKSTPEKIRKTTRRVAENVHRADKMLTEIQPDMVVLIETNYGYGGPITDLAIHREKNVITFGNPPREDSLWFWRLSRRTRRSHLSSITKNKFEDICQEPWTKQMDEELEELLRDRYSGRWALQARNQQNVSSYTKSEILERLGLDAGKKTAVIFSHVLWDANLFYGTDIFQDNAEWFVETIKLAAKNRSMNWIVKLHPANKWKKELDNDQSPYSEYGLIANLIGDLPPHIALLPPETNISTFSLFKAIDFGVTIRGTVGMELPSMGVPVVTAGTGRYAGLGFTIDAASVEDYEDIIRNLHQLKRLNAVEQQRARRFTHAVFCRRPWKMKSFKARIKRYKGSETLDRYDLEQNVISLDGIKRQGDLDKWAKWAIDSSEPEYFES